jgi:hypothetical protein
MPGLDPISGAIGGAQFLVGGIQGLIGSARARKTQAELEGLQTPTLQRDEAVNNYYNQANQNPYSSEFYQNQKNNIQAGVSQGIGALQDRHGALIGIGNLIGNQNRALLNAGATAEQQQKNMLGQATRMKAADDQRLFDVNKMLPYQKKFSLLAQKSAAASQMANAGWKNMFGGLQTGLLGTNFGNKGTSIPGANNGSSPQYYNGYGPNSNYSPFEAPNF